tara:strand:- start:2695 stop:3642 length:948 start_codon:yes stop_codon:yes gene_type:complete
MLSLTRGKRLFDRIEKSTGKRIKDGSIYFNPAQKKESELDIDNYLDVLAPHHLRKAKVKFRLSKWDIENIKRALKAKDKNKLTAGVLVNAYEYLENEVNEILKSMLIFDSFDDRGTEIIPYVKGYSVISIIGSSGVGKSTLSAKIIKNSKRKDQKIFLLTKSLNDPDPAFEEIQDDIIEVAVDDPAELPTLEDMRDSFVLIDDLEGLPKSIREYLFDFIDMVITCGRKLKITTLYSSHISNGYIHRHLLNEQVYKIVFPSSNKWKIQQTLRLKYGISTEKLNEIFSAVKADTSRYLILHLHHPNLYATEKRVVML